MKPRPKGRKQTVDYEAVLALLAAGKTLDETAAEAGCARTTVARIRDTHGATCRYIRRPWTTKEEDTICQTVEDLATLLGRTPVAVMGRMREIYSEGLT